MQVANARVEAMKQHDGLLECTIEDKGEGLYTITQSWSSREAYERWMKSPHRRRSHFGKGVWQFKTGSKYEVPEEYVPFILESLSQ